MSSAFDTAMAARNSSMLERFGESISITPTGGAATDVTAVVDRETIVLEDLDHESRQLHRMTIHVPTSSYATRTMHKDTATIDSATWTVVEEISVEAGMVNLVVQRKVTRDKHGTNARARS